MEKAIDKTGYGFQKGSGKNRLRIHGMATLERDNQENITASYDYSTLCPNDFFEENVMDLQSFELNKIAMGMTIYKKDQPIPKIKNGFSPDHGKNGSKALALQNADSRGNFDPLLTDVIWSRMDITNPFANRNAYIIKQNYNLKGAGNQLLHGEKWNNFWCGFISCCLMVSVGGALGFLYHGANFM